MALHAAGAAEPPASATFSPAVLTSFEKIWQVAESERSVRHPVRFEYVVYYYDPLWHALWGRSGEADSYLSFGTKEFPIKPGQRIRVEGTMVPSQGMTVDDATVTVLADSAPIEVVSTTGHIGDTERFNKRMVRAEGYVDDQVARDANHNELHLIVEGRPITAELLVKSDAAVPALKGRLVRLRGVYFARTDPDGAKLELWVPGLDAIERVVSLDGDPRFGLEPTAVAKLAREPDGAVVRISGMAIASDPGRSVTVRDATGQVTVPTPQTRSVTAGELVDVVGVISRRASGWTITRSLYRTAPKMLAAVEDIYQVPPSELQDVHTFRGEVLVYYYDPYWKVMWGHSGASDNYLSLAGADQIAVKPGQRVLIEGSVTPAKGSVIDHPKLKVLADAVAIPALPTAGHLADVERFNRHVVTVEGDVDRQIQTDPNHIELDLVGEDRLIAVRLLADNIPPMEGARVRVRGVYSATSDPGGGLPKIEVWVQGIEDVAVVGRLDDDKRFNAAITPIENIGFGVSDAPVHVAGPLWSQQPGHSITLRDDTGVLTVRSVQTLRVPPGTVVEAVGQPVREGADVFLAHGLYRISHVTGAATAGVQPLRLAEQLRELPPDEAARGRPVQLTGVVTWAHPEADFFYIRDLSGGACVEQPPGHKAAVIVGLKAEVWGVSSRGQFVPVVAANRVHYTATIDLPEARPVTLEQALTGVEEAQWVSMSGYVRDAVRAGKWERLDVTTSAGEFSMVVPPETRLASLVGSVITARGVCRAVANHKRQLTGIELWVPSIEYIDVDEPATADPYSIPLRSIASLRQFNSLQMANRRIRIGGVVLSAAPGRFVHVQDGTEGVLVLSSSRTPLTPGDRIEAVGFPGRESSRVVLREAIYRRVGAGAEPAPMLMTRPMPPDPELDGRLVRVNAQLLDLSDQENGVRLILQANDSLFEALLDVSKASVPRDWLPGSRVDVTGVYVIEFDENKRPHNARLQLRRTSDVTIVDPASWWTIRHMVAVTSVLAAAMLVGLVWVVALRRRVRRQTEQIRDQLEKEKAARLEAALARASKLESLGILAGGIAHDFNNLLTVIMCNLSLARLDPRVSAETHQCLDEGERATTRARDLTQQLLTFAKGGAPVRAAIVLADVVRESAGFALHGAKSNCEFELASNLWPAHVDKGQIGQVVQNIVINANQAMPDGGTILIKLRNAELKAGAVPPLAAGRYLELTIADTGSGIAADQLPRIFDPYFTTKPHGSGLGLATVYSIVKQHQGHIDVASVIGHGTTFTIWLPAADHEPAPERSAAGGLPACSGRVLFMDDEASIRQLAGAVLRRMGLEVRLVADGAEVIHEFRAAAEARRPYDLVIVDLTVPGGMGGLEAMEHIRAIDPAVRAIVSSGYSSDPVMANHAFHGFAAVITKPYEAAVFAQVVHSVLARRETAPSAR